MRILALSDKRLRSIHSLKIRNRYADADLVVGCGDLPADYLEFVLTVLSAPCIYVPGNHDLDNYRVPGGVSVDGRLAAMAGVRVFGLGGSMRYKREGLHQYTEGEMRSRYLPFLPRILWNRLRTGRGFDLFVTHAPPAGIHDRSDRAHQGFGAFLPLLRLARPALMLHGHVHALRNIEDTETKIDEVTVMNVYPYRWFEWDFETSDG